MCFHCNPLQCATAYFGGASANEAEAFRQEQHGTLLSNSSLQPRTWPVKIVWVSLILHVLHDRERRDAS